MTGEWTTTGARITDPEVLSKLRQILDGETPLIIEHGFYLRATAPYRFVCEDYDALMEYLRTKTSPGDRFYFWRFDPICHEDNTVAIGKVPDDLGRVPIGGAY